MNHKRLISVTAVAAILLLFAPFYGSQLTSTPNPDTQPALIQPALIQPGLTHPVHFTHPFVAAPSSPAAGNQLGQCPLPSGQCWASLNWDGYAVTTTLGSPVTDVKGSWVVPAIVGSTATTCPDTQRTWDDNSIWVGIDGFSNGYVEQTGTSSDCFYGQPAYYAWYELYPAGSVPIPYTVNPGDHMTAEVSYAPLTGLFTTTITDLTGHWTFTSAPSTNCASPGVCAPADSAEWIDESAAYAVPPTPILGLLGLTPVPKITMSSGVATINGITHPISGWGSNINWLEMVDLNWGPIALGYGGEILFYTKAVPSPLEGTFGFGSMFSTTWISSGP